MLMETERRRRKYAQMREAISLDSEALESWTFDDADRAERSAEAIENLANLQRTEDLASFREEMDKWSRKPGSTWFSGFNQMFINQLAKRAEGDPAPVARLLAAALRVPGDEGEAVAKIGSLVTHVEQIKKAGQPAPARVPFITSLFWSMQDHARWPCQWASADNMLRTLGWVEPSNDLPAHYLAYRSVAFEIGAPFDEFEKTLWWLERHPFVGLDPNLTERLAESREILRRWSEANGYQSEDDETIAALNSRAAQGELRLLGLTVQESIAASIGHELKLSQVQVRAAFTQDAAYRADAHVALALEGGFHAPSLRVWATDAGVAVGAFPGYSKKKEEGKSFHADLGGALEDDLPPGMQFFRIQPAKTGSRLEPEGGEYPGGELFVGKWFPAGEALDRRDFTTDVEEAAELLRPVMDRFMAAQGGEAGAKPPLDSTDELAHLVEQFREEQPYPTEKDDWHKSERERLAETLTAESLAAFDLPTFRLIVSGNRYGGPGPQSTLNAHLTSADPAELDRISQNLTTLLWDDQQDDATRINRALVADDLGMRGLGESVIMKLLSITHPQRYIPVFPYTGEMGKRALMRFVHLVPPDPGGMSRGELQVTANDMLRERLDPLLPGDPWGQKSFLYWLRAQEEKVGEGEADSLALLSDELLIDPAFVAEIVELLRERRQLIFYGPPGTGKTYFAKKLAEALSPDPKRHMIVQFHPSTSYEDFFEGYRPDVTAEDQLRYRLVEGPLALMAGRAAETPGVDHIVIIDEINRGNLPKVFGELLYLLEYREDAIHTLYRPDEAFELPSNLYFIGTMNTADRSIALVDAAIRRRFHFIGFFPQDDRSPIAGLLSRWLEAKEEPAWVADFVDMVNDELQERLGGPDLAIGPSYFMKRGLDETRLDRIWRYDVKPTLDEFFYGQREVIKEYEFKRVLARFRQQAGLEQGAAPQADTDETPADA